MTEMQITAEPGVPQVLTSGSSTRRASSSTARSPSRSCWCSGSGRASTR